MSNTIEEQYLEKEKTYKLLGERTNDLLKVLLEQEGVSVHSINCRIKQKDSLLNKIYRKQNKYTNICEVTDIVGIRVITFYSDDVDLIAEIIEREFVVDFNNTIDKRKTLEPSAFGYLSLHYVVQFNENRTNLAEYKDFKDIKLEIQIRTILQHTWAEIEHDLGYKSKIEIPQNVRRDFSRLAGLLELADKEFISIRNKLLEYEKEVTVSLRDEFTEVHIDKISISTYIDVNENLERLNSAIITACSDYVRYRKQNSGLEDIVQRLSCAGFKTTSEIDEAINQEFELCVEIAKNILNDPRKGFIDDTIGLFYLCYAKIVVKSNFDLLYDFLSKSNVPEPNKFGKQLLSIYNDFIHNNLQ